MNKRFYKANKPLVFSILSGLFYFFLCWSIDFGDTTSQVFSILMLFMPGVTFPLATCYFNFKAEGYARFIPAIHLILSVAIYHGCVWLFSGIGDINYNTVLAGFSGSVLYMLSTKFLLKKSISFVQILLTAVLSGLAFLPFEIFKTTGLFIGLAVLCWTIVNGVLMNIHYKERSKKATLAVLQVN